ncbi:hypothetical protein [Shivajiella indica]|uniref:Uncharacterized protein n=1 Tax=Shivajiella indica TaxID=872115 RepID=A0ABW5BBM1_9BACT
MSYKAASGASEQSPNCQGLKGQDNLMMGIAHRFYQTHPTKTYRG